MRTALTRDQIVETLCRLAAQQVDVNQAEVTIDTHLFNDLGFDSLTAVEYTMTIEDEFDVSIPDEHAGEVKTIKDAFDALRPLLPE